LAATIPFVRIGGAEGPLVACSTRTGVSFGAATSGFLEQADSTMTLVISSAPATLIFPVLTIFISKTLWIGDADAQRQPAGGRCIVQLRLACEDFECRYIEIQLRARERAA